jgi:hypothetical protein
MTSIRTARSTRHQSTFRKDFAMNHIELRLAEVQERHQRFRTIRSADRETLGSVISLRHQLGLSLVRLGRRIGGDAVTAPAWQG